MSGGDTNKTRRNLIISAIIVGILACLFTFNGAIYKTLYNLKLTPRNEAFTELYFNNYQQLPTRAVKGKKVSFTFTIHNLEGVTTQYPYIVSFVSKSGRATRITKGTVTLDQDELKTITVSYTFPNSTENGMVVVLLTNLNQQIQFLIPNTN